jgi:nicotinamidase-related amidase
VQKQFGSAFFRTGLEENLNRLGAKTLYICGLATFGCVNATVLCALCKNYDVRVIRNAHGCSSFPGEPAADTIDAFNSSWKRAGATLVSFGDVGF